MVNIVGKTYNRKLSGTAFLALRCLFDLTILGYVLKDLILETSTSVTIPNFIFLSTTIVDLIFSGIFLFYPASTCEGNTYLKSFLDSERPDNRIQYLVAFIIGSLLMYGGIACPLNMAWMETFKPFSRIILIKRPIN